MQIIYRLGQVLSEKIAISEAASRGLLKLAIKEEFGPFKPLNTIGLRDYRLMIKTSLKNRLRDLNVINYEEIIEFLLNELIKNQSLITMEKI